MDRVPLDAIPAIERDFVNAMVRKFDLDLRQLRFDATNLFTYIDTFNERSRLAQHGHSREGRNPLRIVGVALLVTSDFRLPLLHSGEIPDRTNAGWCARWRTMGSDRSCRQKSGAVSLSPPPRSHPARMRSAAD